MRIHTIGFTRSSAEDFFARLSRAGVRRVLDVRLRPGSQLAGFANARDLPYLLDRLADGASYAHEPLLAPTPALLDAYRGGGEWEGFERGFLDLLAERRVESVLEPADFDTPTALLCAEASARRCHRRLVCEHLGRHWPDVRATHL